MDIRARYLLGEIRKLPSAKHSIIAGGAVRDNYFGIEPKDYDFFIPSDFSILSKVRDLTGNQGIKSDKKYSYSKHLPIIEVFNFDYQGIDAQFMVTRFKDNDEFEKKVMDSFDFGINKIYYTGSIILNDSEEFQKDAQDRTMTLYHLTDMKYLPKYVDRYQRISNKLPGNWEFKCPYLKLFDRDGNEVVSKPKTNPYLKATLLHETHDPRQVVNQVRAQLNVPNEWWAQQGEVRVVAEPAIRWADAGINGIINRIDGAVRPQQVQPQVMRNQVNDPWADEVFVNDHLIMGNIEQAF